jgi:prepilin-type N-terminal cleavage/methylation domain-containing protein
LETKESRLSPALIYVMMLYLRQNRAFTLIELLVVILLIAVMASVVVPSYSRFLAKSRFEGTTRDIQDLFAYAREKAITQDTTATLTYDPQSETFTVMVTPPPPQTDQPVALTTGDNQEAAMGAVQEPPRTVQLNPQFSIAQFASSENGSGSGAPNGGQGNFTEIHFRGDGTSDGAEIALVSETGYSAKMILWPSTSRLTLEDDTAGNR